MPAPIMPALPAKLHLTGNFQLFGGLITGSFSVDLPTSKPPVRAESQLQPPATRHGVPIMDFDLKNDWVLGPITIVVKDDEGNVVPTPDGVAFSSTVSDPTLLGVVDNDGLSWTCNALMRRGTVAVTHHDASGLVPDFTDNVNIVEDFTPASADSDIADAKHTSQPLPAA